jgi:hypothetical protein
MPAHAAHRVGVVLLELLNEHAALDEDPTQMGGAICEDGLENIGVLRCEHPADPEVKRMRRHTRLRGQLIETPRHDATIDAAGTDKQRVVVVVMRGKMRKFFVNQWNMREGLHASDECRSTNQRGKEQEDIGTTARDPSGVYA